MSTKTIGLASVNFNQDFFEIITCSFGGLWFGELSISPFYLLPDANNEKLGQAVREALHGTKYYDNSQFMKLHSSGVLKELDKKREKVLMKKYGYKTKKAMWQMMDSCTVSLLDNSQIKIQPLHQNSLTGYSGISNDGPEIINISSSVSDEELGAAIREGFKWCTSIYGRI